MDIAKLQQQVSEYLDRGEYDEAIALCEQSINTDPALMFCYQYLGLARLLQESDSEAEAIWLSAMSFLSPDEIDGWMVELVKVLETVAIRYLHDRKLQLAEKIYWQILELDSHNALAYYNLGDALAQQANFDAAIECWQSAIDLEPNLVQAYESQGSVFQKLENFAAASEFYLKALQIQPNPEVSYNLGLCLLQQNRLDEAIAYFQNAIYLKSDYTQAYGDLGYALLQQGNLGEAVILFNKGIKTSFATAYSHWVDTLTKQQSDRQDNAVLLKALHLNPLSFETYLYLGKLLARQNNFMPAIASYQKAISIQESSEAYFELGQALAQKENFESAIAAYQKAIQMQPESAEIYFKMGKAIAETGDLEQAIAAYQKALQIAPDLSEVYLDLGNAMLNSGRRDRAIACYQKSLELQPNYLEACWHLGIALAQNQQPEEALAYFQKAIQINPDIAGDIGNSIMVICQQNHLGVIQHSLAVEPPNAFYESTWDWAIKYDLDKSNYINVYPENIINLLPPLSIDKAIHFSFRFGDRVELPATFVALLPDGRYWLNKNEDKSAVIASDNHFLADISPDFPVLSPGHPDKHPSNHSIFHVGKLPPIQKIDGTVAVLAGLLNNLYFHWMFDILPRIELLQKSGIDFSKIDKFLVNSRFPFQKETLKLFGIAEAQILQSDRYPHIQASRLIVPSFPGSVAWMPKWACDFLKSTFLDKKAVGVTEKTKRLYISRKETANRRLINEEEVIRCLKEFGFRSVTLESMLVTEQAALFASAKVVVAPHGSGLTNTVFCDPGTKVIEIFSPNYVYPCYWLISNLVQLEYYYLLGENSVGFSLYQLLYPNSRLEDIYVNIDDLLNILKFAQAI